MARMSTPAFTGYSPAKMQTMAHRYGYTDENMGDFGTFLEENPSRAKEYFDQQNLDMFGEEKMRQFKAGGLLAFQQGGAPSPDWNAAVNQYSEGPQDVPSSGNKWYGFGSLGDAQSAFATFRQANPDQATQFNTSFMEGYTPPAATPSAPPSNLLQMPTVGVTPQVPAIATETAARYYDPRLPQGGQVAPAFVPLQQEQLIAEGIGQLGAAQQATAQQAALVQQAVPSVVQAEQITDVEKATPAIEALTVQAAQMQAPSQLVAAAEDYDTNVSNLQAAQLGQAVQIESPAVRALQTGETIATAVGQAAQAAAFTEPAAQAATATPTTDATVQGQLAGLMLQFEQSEDTPIWARGAVRLAQQEMAKRGLSASSMAGQAMVEAAMESAISIAQIDASVIASFEKQNLSNRQQMATLRAEQRASFMGQEFDQEFKIRVQNAAKITDIANFNASAEQQIILENSRLAQTVDLANLSSQEAFVTLQATALNNLETTSLNNIQKASVENAKNFLQVDMSNLSNVQQASMFKSQTVAQALLTDTAAQNIATNMNVTEANQMARHQTELIANINKTNTIEANERNRFNAGESNNASKLNAEIANQRDQYNATNQRGNAQSNAMHRRDIATIDTAAANFANQRNAQSIMNISDQAYANMWQESRDLMEMAFTGSENALERFTKLEIEAVRAQRELDVAAYQAARENSRSVGKLLGDLFIPGLQAVVTGELTGIGAAAAAFGAQAAAAK
tara:strand:+ start:1787 stop:4003 length:2217 start_codon:yes stop_codon:yes gene_type:complete